MSPATVTAAVGDAVLTPDGVMHAVTAALSKGRVELACGLVSKGLALATDPTSPLCADCASGTKTAAVEVAPRDGDAADLSYLPETPALSTTTDAPADVTPLALALPEIADALQDNPDLQADGEAALAADAAATTPEPVAAAAASTVLVVTTIANQPTKAATEAKAVGNYTIEQLKKAGPYRLRDTRDGKLAPEAFEVLGDAAWFAQRRTRLAQYVGFGGSRRLFMPKVPGNVGPYTIVGELGRVEVQRDGERVGPVWGHKTNGKVDAMRWAERLLRPTRATA